MAESSAGAEPGMDFPLGIGAAADAAHCGGGKLVICPTPIGNLGDVTQRVLDALRLADVVCAEDTRVTGKLLTAYHIEKPLERLDEARIGSRACAIVQRVLDGQVIAYCTDAGMPGVSDPGLRLVAAARAADAAVEVLPGASAAACAYVASGTVNQHYYFGGFFPRKAGEQKRLLASLRNLDAALVFYESPNRILATLEAIARAFPLRQVSVCRELTKLHEEVVRDVAPALAEAFRARACAGSVKGEIVVVVDGPCAQEEAACVLGVSEDAAVCARQLAAQGLRAKEIAHRLAEQFGLSRNAAYDMALEAVRAAGASPGRSSEKAC